MTYDISAQSYEVIVIVKVIVGVAGVARVILKSGVNSDEKSCRTTITCQNQEKNPQIAAAHRCNSHEKEFVLKGVFVMANASTIGTEYHQKISGLSCFKISRITYNCNKWILTDSFPGHSCHMLTLNDGNGLSPVLKYSEGLWKSQSRPDECHQLFT